MQPNTSWQMDGTHISEFGRLSHIDVSIDNFSKFVWATPLPGVRTAHVIQHLLETSAVMGPPSKIKTDYGPTYQHIFLINLNNFVGSSRKMATPARAPELRPPRSLRPPWALLGNPACGASLSPCTMCSLP